MGSQLQACITMWSAFRPISKQNGSEDGGEEGDKHNNNDTKSNTLVLLTMEVCCL